MSLGVIRRRPLFACRAAERALLLALALAALDRCKKQESGAAPAPDAGVARGDRVLVEDSAAHFVEARVLKTSREKLKVQTLKDARTVTIARADAYALDTARALQAGFAACRLGDARWEPCRIERSTSGVAADLLDGTRRRLTDRDVLGVSELTRLNIQRRFEQARERAEFERALSRAGWPRAPDDWQPVGRERVVAWRAQGWFSATVHELEKSGRIRVRYRADDAEAALERARVVPEPPLPGVVTRGHFALMRPASMANGWVPVRVVGAGEDSVRVVDVDGEVFERQRQDLLPLVAGGE